VSLANEKELNEMKFVTGLLKKKIREWRSYERSIGNI